jgi:hypothetical protein
MNIILTIPDEQAPRVVNALCAKYGYQESILNPETGIMESNPQTKVQFAKHAVINLLKRVTREVETDVAILSISVIEPDIT